uniref:Uncharacterized protein n=1 Tax=Tanacetum cinerariifolium TaxID=118510 RepID=A0A6L2KQ58_TANCI|nr:hypothetical protein [Tanacetum cinerariifolium]
MDDAYLQTQLLITQKEEVGIQLQAEEFDLMAAAVDLDEFEEVNANCILMANLQQASTSVTQTNKALIYDSNRSTKLQVMPHQKVDPCLCLYQLSLVFYSLGIANRNQNGNANVVAAQAKVRPRRMDDAYLQTQLLITQKEEVGIQLQAEEFDLMAAAVDLDEFEEVNANCILMANLQQASTSVTQTNKALIYDSNRSTKTLTITIIDSLQIKLHDIVYENTELRAQLCDTVFEQKDITKGGFIDKFVRDPNKRPDSSQRPPYNCPKCGNPVDGLYFRQCALLQKKLKEVWFIICDENEIFQDFLNTSESSKDNTNVVNAPQEPFVFNQDPDENSFTYDPNLNFVDDSPNPPPQPPTYSYEYCGSDAHYGHDCPPQKIPIYYDDDDDDKESSIPLRDSIIFELPPCIAITPVLSTEEPVDSLIMKDEHLDTISATKSDEVIKSSVKNLVPSQDFYESNDDSTLSDDDSFEDIDYAEASPPDFEPVSLEEVKDEILCVKLLNANLLIAKIESLNDNLTPNCVLKSPSLFLIPVEDSDSFFEKSDTSLSYLDNSLPEFKTFSDHTEETSSGSTTTHADNSFSRV